jgi:hypothetical protein
MSAVILSCLNDIVASSPGRWSYVAGTVGLIEIWPFLQSTPQQNYYLFQGISKFKGDVIK